jgi:hypothetical protein
VLVEAGTKKNASRQGTQQVYKSLALVNVGI